jgi:hypothetical protein
MVKDSPRIAMEISWSCEPSTPLSEGDSEGDRYHGKYMYRCSASEVALGTVDVLPSSVILNDPLPKPPALVPVIDIEVPVESIRHILNTQSRPYHQTTCENSNARTVEYHCH